VGFIKKLAILALKLHLALADRLYGLVAISSEMIFAPCETKSLKQRLRIISGVTGLVP
jgi:hypothetical protein